jgi:hypothetical protein
MPGVSLMPGVSVNLLQQHLLAANIVAIGLRRCVYEVAEVYDRDHADLEDLNGHLRGADCTVGDLRERLPVGITGCSQRWCSYGRTLLYAARPAMGPGGRG